MKIYVKYLFLILVSVVLASCASATPTTVSPAATDSPAEAAATVPDEPTEAATNSPDEPTAVAELTETAEDPATAEASGSLGEVATEEVEVVSEGQAYQSYLAAPTEEGPHPAVVLIHSFNGMEEGYRTMTDRFAAEGFVVLAVGWQTFERQPADAVVQQLMVDSIAYLSSRPDVDSERLGLTGFCAGGRYTMLFLPQIDSFKAGVAWYGFPYNGDPAPAAFIDQLDAPMLIIHGTADDPSPIEDIYQYTEELEAANRTFQLEVYEGEPHGFMLSNGQLREDENAQDAFNKMIEFFKSNLG